MKKMVMVVFACLVILVPVSTWSRYFLAKRQFDGIDYGMKKSDVMKLRGFASAKCEVNHDMGLHEVVRTWRDLLHRV